MKQSFAQLARERLARERGRIDKQAPFTVGLTYPSPYRVGMSSLGFQQVYKQIQHEPGMAAERFFLPDATGSGPLASRVESYESVRPLGDLPVVALSVAYELELAGVAQILAASGVGAGRETRNARQPLVLAGGPLTFSNPLPLGWFADAIIMGEADTLVLDALRVIRDAGHREQALRDLAQLPHVFVPQHHGRELPPIAKCEPDLLPAWAPIRTPDTELSDMFLIEAERGCSRSCTYCVMRRTTNGGMRLVSQERLLSLIPEDADRVGLVGAAVSDHPAIVDIVNALCDRGATVGLSSLRPNRLSDPFVAALKRAGYRTLTTAMDGASGRMREVLDRRAKDKHLVQAAELTRKHQIPRLKLYLMLGVPGETDDDIDECAAFTSELSRICPVSLTVAPFCAKRNTPLDGQPFAGIKVVEKRIKRLRKGLRGRAEVRATSARWAWVEYVLAQGGYPEGEALYAAVQAGGRFADYKKAFAARSEKTVRRKLFIVRPTADLTQPKATRWMQPVERATVTERLP
ncbi:MAG: radical SAM protein [Myxococcota bacterium]